MTLKFGYHDAYIDALTLDDANHSCTWEVVGYNMLSGEQRRVRTVFRGIMNWEKVQVYMQSILDGEDMDGFGVTIYGLEIDEKKESKEGSVYLFLNASGPGKICIHCESVEEEDLGIGNKDV